MQSQFDTIAAYPTLTDAQRIQALQTARRNLIARIGDEPRFEDFAVRQHSRYGRAEGWIGALLAITVLMAAFIISAVHVFGVGRRTYLETGGTSLTATVIGLALVILAEASVLALSVLPTLWDTSKRVTVLMYTGVVASAFIAAVGNIDATILYSSSPFDWVRAWAGSVATAPSRFALATLPPALTVMVGMGLKYWLLSSSRLRHEAQSAYETALQEWQQTVNAIEEHKNWRLAWATAIWDLWRSLQPSDVLAEIDDEMKVAIIMREIQAEDRLRLALESGAIAPKFSATTRKPDRSNREIVEEFYRNHPDALQLQQKEIAELLGISESAVSRHKPSTNGHGGG